MKKVLDDSSNAIETYTYGATRERLMTETSGGRTYYVWGGQSVIAEYTETGTGTIPTFTKSYVYAGSRLLMISYSSGSAEFHHPDRIGTQFVTFGGTINGGRQSTYPFGTLEQGPQSNQVFTSYDRSTSTGLDYAVNRTYSSGQSRFTQVDPIGLAAASIGNPQSNNMYAYVQNMPTDFVDPSGLNMECTWEYRTFYTDGAFDSAGWYRVCTNVASDNPATRCYGPSCGGGGTGPGPILPVNPPRGLPGNPPTLPPRSPVDQQQKKYRDCVDKAWSMYREAHFADGLKAVYGTALIIGGTAFTVFEIRHGRSKGILERGLAAHGVASVGGATLLAGGVLIGDVFFSGRNEARTLKQRIADCKKRYPSANHSYQGSGIIL